MILIRNPAAFAAAIPSSTCPKRPQRVMAENFATSSVSSDTLMRRTPHSTNSAACFASCDPFVVSVNSRRAPLSRCRDMARKKVMIPFLTKGSPPVIRSFSTPSRTKAEQSLSNSSSVRRSALGRKVMFSAIQ